MKIIICIAIVILILLIKLALYARERKEKSNEFFHGVTDGNPKTEEKKPPKGQISLAEAQAMPRHARRHLGKINGFKIPSSRQSGI